MPSVKQSCVWCVCTCMYMCIQFGLIFLQSYINIDTSNPSASQSSAQTPPTTGSSQPSSSVANGPTKPKTPGKLPPLPDKDKVSPSSTSPKDDHVYQNVVSSSTGSQAPPTPQKPGKVESESQPQPPPPDVSSRPPVVQRSISSTPTPSGSHAPPLTPIEKSKDDDKPHLQPKPRPRSKKSNSDATTAPSGPAPALPATNTRPTLGQPKPAPPKLTPRVKVSAEDSVPSMSKKPPKLPDRIDPSPTTSPTRTAVSATDEWGKVQPEADEDEFGYGLINVADSAPKLPAVPKSPRPTRAEPAGKGSMMDTVNIYIYIYIYIIIMDTDQYSVAWGIV